MNNAEPDFDLLAAQAGLPVPMRIVPERSYRQSSPFEKVPPHDIESEMAALGCMFDSTLGSIVIEMLELSDFYVPRHRILFQVLLDLFSKHEFIDEIYVASELDRRGLLDQIGGRDALGNIVGRSTIAVEATCETLRAKRATRQMLEAAAKVVHAVNNPGSKTAGELCQDAQAELSQIQYSQSEPDAHAALKIRIQAEISGEKRAIPIPWHYLDDLTQMIMPGTMTVISGNPGATKSLMLLEMLWWISEEQNEKVAVLEAEDGSAYHLRRAIAQHNGFGPFTNMRWVRSHPCECAEIFAAEEQFVTRFKNCIEACGQGQKTTKFAMNWIRQKIAKDIKVIAIDAYTLLDFGGNVIEVDKRFVSQAKELIEKTNTHLILVIHPQKKPAQGKIPSLNDLALTTQAAREAHAGFWIDPHDMKTAPVKTSIGTTPTEFNQTITILKARDAGGGRKQLAFHFEHSTLRTKELGVLV